MAASESVSLNSGASSELTFAFFPLRFVFSALQPLYFVPGETANRLRGLLGKALFEQGPVAYQRLFTPSSADGPSGLRDLPRPFVLRVAHLDGARFGVGETFAIGVNLFDMSEPTIKSVQSAVCAAVRAPLVRVEGALPLELRLTPPDHPVRRIRVRFLTPTELKGADQPEFGVLFSRIRDRVSTLRALCGEGPLPIGFREMGERARDIRMTRCELDHIDAERVSRRTGQRHSLGGFIGVAEYDGALAEFLPYLQAARWTGVGRQTVWGKGEIACEEI
jgi:hypothetical protein